MSLEATRTTLSTPLALNASVTVRRALTETRAILRKADALYSPWSCSQSAACCQLATTGRPPWLWPTEWRLLLDRLARDARPLPPPRSDGACPFLDEGGARCTIYAVRPFGCRTFFCERRLGPGQEPTLATGALLERLAALNLELDGQAKPHALPDLVSRP